MPSQYESQNYEIPKPNSHIWTKSFKNTNCMSILINREDWEESEKAVDFCYVIDKE